MIFCFCLTPNKTLFGITVLLMLLLLMINFCVGSFEWMNGFGWDWVGSVGWLFGLLVCLANCQFVCLLLRQLSSAGCYILAVGASNKTQTK